MDRSSCPSQDRPPWVSLRFGSGTRPNETVPRLESGQAFCRSCAGLIRLSANGVCLKHDEAEKAAWNMAMGVARACENPL